MNKTELDTIVAAAKREGAEEELERIRRIFALWAAEWKVNLPADAAELLVPRPRPNIPPSDDGKGGWLRLLGLRR